MGNDRGWAFVDEEDLVDEPTPDKVETEHEAPSEEAAAPVPAEQDEVVGGYRVYPGIVRKGSPGRHVIDTDGLRRRIVD